MANKDNVDLGTDDLDDLNFDDLDFSDPFAPSSDNRSPIEAAAKSAISTVKDRMLDKGLLRRMLAMALPKGYSQAFNAYDALDNAAGDILKDKATDLQPYLRSMNVKFAQMSPAVKRALPKSVRDALEAAENDHSTGSGDSQPDELTSNIAGLDKLFAQQANDKVKSEFRDAVKDTRENKRFASEMDVLTTMGRGIGRLVGYQDSVTINYQRKSLELKYRHLDVSIRTLKAQQEFFSLSKTYLDGIQKNTGLPDFVKMRSTEVLKQQLQQRLAAGAMRSAGNFTSNYFNGIKKNAGDLLSGAIEVHQQLGQGEQFGQTRAQMFGTMAGGLIGDAASSGLELLGGTLADKAAPYIEQIPGVQAGGNWLRKNLTGIPQRLNEYAKSDTTREGLLGLGEEAIKALLDRHSPTSSVQGAKLDSLDQPAIFDNMFHRAVTDVIPSFLASMDRKLGILATGEDQEEQAYSHYSNSLVNRSELNKSHVRLALKDNNGQGIRSEVDSILREMNANDLSVEAKRALRRQLMKDMTAANDFKPERYVKVNTWNTVPEEIAEELIDFFADTFGLDPGGNQIDNSQKTQDLTASTRSKFLELSERLPDFGGRMDVLQNVVGRRSWRELGLSRHNGDYNDVIDMDALNDLIVNEGEEKDLTNKPEDKPVYTGSIQERVKQKAEYERKRLQKEREQQATGKPQQGVPVVDNRPIKPRPSPIGTAPVVPQSVQVQASVEWPDLLMTSDVETHLRLDNMLSLSQQSNQWLEYILEASLDGPEAAAAATPDASPSTPDEAPAEAGGKRWWQRRPSARKVIGGAITGTARGLGKYFGFTYGMIGKGLGLGTRAALGAAKLPFGSINGLGVSDVHLLGDPEPVMTARDIRKGKYFDVNSKKVIESIKDITGPVQNVDSDELVLTQEDFDKGLYNGKGESLAGWGLRKGAALTGLAARGVKAYVGGTYGLMWKAAKWGAQTLVDQFAQFDAYLPGDEEPRIRSVLMKKGVYRDKDGAPIMSLKDIKGPVYMMEPGDKELREIVSQEEIDKYKSFYTRNGSVLFTVGRAGINLGVGIGKLALKGAKAYGKLALGFYKGLWKGAKAIGSGIGSLFNKGRGRGAAVGMLDDELAIAAVEIQGEQLKTQQSILSFLRNKWDKEGVHGDVDGDGSRDWSWQDILKRRKEAAEGKDSAAASDNADIIEAIEKLNKNLDHKLDDLVEATEEAGESSLLEDAADLSEIRGEKRGRKGRKPGIKPKGRLARAGSWIGKKLGKIPGVGAIGRGIGYAAPLVGGALWSGAAAIGSGLATAGTAVVSALGLPLILGAAAVAGIGYLGYRYYKSSQAKKFPLLYLRMTQYGVAPTNQERVEKIIQLESLCRSGVDIGRDGTAQLDPSKIDIQAVLKVFSISDPDQQESMFRWMSSRFRPVFLAHCTAMQRIRQTAELSSADQGIGNGDLDSFLNVVDLGNMQDIYNDTSTSPFDSSLDTDADDVADAVKMVRSRREDKQTDEIANVAGAVAAGSVEVAARNATVGVSRDGTGSAAEIAKGLEVAAAAASSIPGAVYGGVAPAVSQLKSLDIPTAVRYKTYGLKEMNLSKCQQLQKVEEVYWGTIQYSGTSKAVMGGDSVALEQKVSDIFRPADENQKADMLRWLNYRFIPVMLQYAISVRRRYNGDARDGARNLTGTLMHEVLDEVTRTMADTMMGQTSVWTITNSPWPGFELETLPGSVKAYLDVLDQQDENKVMNVQGLATAKRIAGAEASYGTTLTNTALGNQRSSSVSPGVGQTGPTLANYGKIYSGKQVAGGAPGETSKGVADGSLLMVGPKGTKVEHPGGGTGGDINSLPDASGKGWGAMGPLIQAAAKMVGFDPVIAGNVAGIESRWDPKASSGIANGLFQFIGSTWRSMIKKYGATYGIDPNTPPTDPRANAILGACYLKENYEGLSKTLGGSVSDLDLYMAHFLGLGGAKRFLSAPKNVPAHTVVGNGQAGMANDVVKNNASVFIGKTGPRSVGEVLGEMDRRMNDVRKTVGGPLSPVAATVAATDVPAGPTPTDTAPANPTPGGALETPEGGAQVVDDGSGPVTVSQAVAQTPPTPMEVAAAANGGASGTPTGAPPSVGATMPVSETTTTGNEPVIPTSIAGAAVPAPSPTRNMATVAQNTQVAQQANTFDTITPILQKHLEVSMSMDETLRQMLRNQLQALQNSPAAKPLVAANTPEPMQRQPMDTRRTNAVT